MKCPLVVYPVGTLGTVEYYAACECMSMCDYTKCKYRQSGIVITFASIGTTTTNTVNITGKSCGGSFPLVAASDNALVTNADLAAGQTYTIVPTYVGGVLRGVVQGL